MNYSRIRTADPLALGLEISSLTFFPVLGPSPLDYFIYYPFCTVYNKLFSSLLINNKGLFLQ